MRRGVVAAVVSVGGHGVALALLLLVVEEPVSRPVAPRVGFDLEEKKQETGNRQPATGNRQFPDPDRARARTRTRLLPAPAPAAAAAPAPAPAPAAGASAVTSPLPSTTPSTTPSTDQGAPPGQTANPESIRAAIAAVIRYPRIARSQGLTGRVVVRFRIAGGRPQEVQIVTSAGAILDGAATDAVNRAAPFDQPDGWVRVPVDFSMQATR
jgi:TonB family protein